MINIDKQTVCNLLAQRRKFLSLMPPPPRYTPVSPYPTYTKQQLDMRRKIEVLQYKKNTTQTNQPTRSQSWAKIANSRTNSAVVCYKNPYIPTSTTACDVPGPPIELSYDPSVPLYNYQTNQDAYSFFVDSTIIPWSFIVDISGGEVAANLSENTIGSLLIREIKEKRNTFQITIPIGLYVSGEQSNSSGSIKISKAILNIYNTDTTPYMTIPFTDFPTNTMTFVANSVGFYGSQYIGNIDASVSLNTFYGFVYDFKLYVEVEFVPDTGSSVPSYGVYINIPAYDTAMVGCTIEPQNPPIFSNYKAISMTGPF